ncbi:mannosyltransferase [Scheffersomyces amazonensis]|uniref:mannosyltransferase n=1 Tax=Scheffersomyces amazonensis TaxID=1078765 RepID=UPI00315C8DF9
MPSLSKYWVYPRLRQKALILAAGLIWLICINLWLFNYFSVSSSGRTITGSDSDFEVDYSSSDKVKDKDNNKDNQKSSWATVIDVDKVTALQESLTVQLYLKEIGVQDVRNIKPAQASIYDQIFENHDINSVLGDLNFNDRCQLYFANLYIKNNNWLIDPNQKLPADNLREFEYNEYRNKKKEDFKKEYISENNMKEEDFKADDKFEAFIKLKYNEFWDRTRTVEQKVMDNLSHLRIFNKCFIEIQNKDVYSSTNNFVQNQNKFISHLTQVGKSPSPPFSSTEFEEKYANLNVMNNCKNLEKRLFPWLSFNYPVFERWNGETLIELPKLGKSTTNSNNFHRDCFLNEFKNKANGKGIVLSINNNFVDDTIHLIHLLRALDNQLPIQVVYYKEVSKESKQRITRAAREDFFTLPESFQKVKHLFPKDYLVNGLPKQDIWFVDVYTVINDQYRGKFSRWSNKFLATLFNSFEEYILIDADTVFVQKPESFFNLKGYREKGALFFRDRTAMEFRPISDGYFVKKVSPSPIDHVLFNIPMITNKTTSYPFFDGLSHLMESGLVVIDRNKHFGSTLLLPQLNFMDPTRARVWGDKELFWMAFVFNGDENFHFNEAAAAAIGTLSPDKVKDDGTLQQSKEICSSHPGHISGEDLKTLLWFNSGFQQCGKADSMNYKDELKKNDRHLAAFKTIEELRDYYSNPLDITHAIIPPFEDKYRMNAPNDQQEPRNAWNKLSLCKGYSWCAHDFIGGTRKNKNTLQRGTLIEYSEEERSLFKFYGDIWGGLE